MRFRLVVTDLDGTLLSSRHQISPRNLAALKGWAAGGAHICVATGRHPASALRLTSVFEFPYTLIGMNGAVVIDQPSGDVRHRNYLRPSETQAIMQAIDALGLDQRRDVFTLETCYATEIDDEVTMRAKAMGLTLRLAPQPCKIEAAKVMVQTPRSRSREILERARALLPRMHVVLSTPTLLEITAPGVSKGSAVIRLADELGVPCEEIIVFGDQLNDVDMLESVGYGVAMANAEEEVKAVAERVTLPHDDDGVALVLEEFLPAS